MLKIRLARGGAKKRPYYAIVIADSHSPRDGRFIDKVGAYDPLLKRDDPRRVTLQAEKIKVWLSKGAQPTDRVARFLAAEGLAKWEHGANPKKGAPHAKAQERVKERADRAAAREEAEASRAAEAAAAPALEEAAPVAEEAVEAPTPEVVAEEAPAEDAASSEQAAPADEP